MLSKWTLAPCGSHDRVGREIMTWITSLLLLFLAGSAAMAEEFPQFNIETMCRAAPRLGSSEKNTDQNCIQDETRARNQLEQQWTSYDAHQRNLCAQETNVG